jgi:hypothetical protein
MVLSSLFRSRKFWLLILDTVVSLLTFFVGKYATPATAQDLLTVIATLQPVFVAVIVGIAYEDGQAKSSAVTYEDVTPLCEEPRP